MNNATIDTALNDLFLAVHQAGIFPDFKIFADARPLHDVALIKEKYAAEKTLQNFDLEAFINKHFELGQQTNALPAWPAPARTVREHIERLWPVLVRTDAPTHDGSSRIPLPQPYVVPGGRFNEIYYWDSYFTMLGLSAAGKVDLIEGMVDNFAHLIIQYGFVPNGSRSYYLSRSQPPYFYLMVELLAQHRSAAAIGQKYFEALETEYAFWSRPERTITMPNGSTLTTYRDASNQPRIEMYTDDVHLAATAPGRTDLFRHLRSACESGWDFSSRWLGDGHSLGQIETTHIVPIDLNCLLCGLEDFLAKIAQNIGETALAQQYQNAHQCRRDAINAYLWNKARNRYEDYNHVRQQHTGVLSAAIAYPLFHQVADPHLAKATIETLRNELLKPGGIVTTNNHTGQQWDAPNGWAPLQWVAYRGFQHYGAHDAAQTLRERWLTLNDAVFARTGKMLEKYNVENLSLEGGGGEYPVQDGFGWTNGVYLALVYGGGIL
jgi:alpha,alpha-trehalase